MVSPEIHTSAELRAFVAGGASIEAILAVVDKLLLEPDWVVLDLSMAPPALTIGYLPTRDAHTFMFHRVEAVRRYGQRGDRRPRSSRRRRPRPAPAEKSDGT